MLDQAMLRVVGQQCCVGLHGPLRSLKSTKRMARGERRSGGPFRLVALGGTVSSYFVKFYSNEKIH